MIRARSLAALLGLLLLAACFAPSKADLIKKADGATSRSELEAALGAWAAERDGASVSRVDGRARLDSCAATGAADNPQA